MTTELTEIRKETQESREESRRGLAWLAVLRTPFDGKHLKDATANQNLVFSWLHPGESLTPKLLERIFKDRPKAKNELIWLAPELTPQQKKQQQDTRRAVFQDACHHFRISECEANWSHLQEFCDFEYLAVQAIQNIGVHKLVRARQEELDEWEQQAQQQRITQLKAMDKESLRNAVNEEFQDRRQAAHAAESNRVFAEKEKADQGMYPPLPSHFRGRKLDKEFFVKHCDRATMKFLNQKFGPANVEARIRGIR